MKKLLVVLLAMAMTLALATCATAASSLYIDRIWEGKENENDNYFTGTFVGGGALFDKFKVGAEYGLGRLDGTTDLTLWNIKFGYRIVDNNGTKLDVVLVYMNLAGNHDIAGDLLETTATAIGLDFTQYFSKDFLVSLQYNYSISADTFYLPGGGDLAGDNSVSVLRFKATYFFSGMVGASLGYQSLIIDNEAATVADFTALSLGVTFRFM